MFRLRTKLIFLFALLITVVLVTWLYAQQSYSAYNVSGPADSGLNPAENLATNTVFITTLTPTPGHTPTVTSAPTNINPDTAGCTYPMAYWQQNKDQIPAQILVNISANSLYEACVNYAQSEVCARLGETSTAPDEILRQQFLVALINYLSGADPSAIANTVNDAYEWLRENASNDSFTNEEAQIAQAYAEILQSYNEGEIGPGACAIEIIPLTQGLTPTHSPTVASTLTASTPTSTSSPTVRRTVVIASPTSTEEQEEGPKPTRTPLPPEDTESPPTDTPLPQPSATEALQPTSTDLPTPTPVSEIPTPTPVPEIATPTPVP